MGIFTSIGKRTIENTDRLEDKVLNIINDRSLGSLNIFANEQLALFDKIVQSADNFFQICPPESKGYSDDGHFMEVPIFLVPFEVFKEHSQRQCGLMNELYQKERNRILESGNKTELDAKLERLRRKYEPWVCDTYPSCVCCDKVFHTPLGYYVPDDGVGKIYICLDRIIDLYPDDVTAVSAMVILHELGHAIMHNPKHPSYESLFEYWVEESLANKIALKYLSVASVLLGMSKLLDVAEAMVGKQPRAYGLGLYLFEHNASDWHTLKENKDNINQTMGDRWVDVVCDSPMGNYDEIQRLFYRAFDCK